MVEKRRGGGNVGRGGEKDRERCRQTADRQRRRRAPILLTLPFLPLQFFSAAEGGGGPPQRIRALKIGVEFQDGF